ncbi:hypothetical protein [Gimesia maris]|uniref:hypothetical protein n=1 Tax=Planctomycetia TaxID=203683 RepID=UPI003A9284DA
MPIKLLDQLPSLADVSEEIAETSRRGRHLRSLYHLILRIRSGDGDETIRGCPDDADSHSSAAEQRSMVAKGGAE